MLEPLFLLFISLGIWGKSHLLAIKYGVKCKFWTLQNQNNSTLKYCTSPHDNLLPVKSHYFDQFSIYCRNCPKYYSSLTFGSISQQVGSILVRFLSELASEINLWPDKQIVQWLARRKRVENRRNCRRLSRFTWSCTMLDKCSGEKINYWTLTV